MHAFICVSTIAHTHIVVSHEMMEELHLVEFGVQDDIVGDDTQFRLRACARPRSST